MSDPTLFTNNDQEEVAAKKPAKKTAKLKKASSLVSGFTMAEVMEYFDWGFIFPNAYLPLLLGENDYTSRFKGVEGSFQIEWSAECFDPSHYYMEVDTGDIEQFLRSSDGNYYSEFPIPTHFVKRIVCSNEKAKSEFLRLWEFTDNDPIEVVANEFRSERKPKHASEKDNGIKQEVLEIIKHLDRCFGAICFTKDLDPFIFYNFKGYNGADDFSQLTISQKLLLLIHEWMPEKYKKIFSDLVPQTKEAENRYVEFFNRLVSKEWDDSPAGIYLKYITNNESIDAIISGVTAGATDDEQKKQLAKTAKTLKELDLGITSLQLALEDDDLRKPYPLFLMLLKLFYRKGKIETDALSFRKNLFEKDLIKNPRNISLIGALYGYYTGYHNFRKYENNRYIDEFDIAADQVILDLFRLRLSTKDDFEIQAFNVIYNKIVEHYPNVPKLKVNFKQRKTTAKEIVKEVISGEGEKKIFKFKQVPQLGKYGYVLTVTGGVHKSIRRLIELLGLLIKSKFKIIAGIIVIDFLKSQKINNPEIVDNVQLSIVKSYPIFELELNSNLLSSTLQDHLDSLKESSRFIESVEDINKVLQSLDLKKNIT